VAIISAIIRLKQYQEPVQVNASPWGAGRISQNFRRPAAHGGLLQKEAAVVEPYVKDMLKQKPGNEDKQCGAAVDEEAMPFFRCAPPVP